MDGVTPHKDRQSDCLMLDLSMRSVENDRRLTTLYSCHIGDSRLWCLDYIPVDIRKMSNEELVHTLNTGQLKGFVPAKKGSENDYFSQMLRFSGHLLDRDQGRQGILMPSCTMMHEHQDMAYSTGLALPESACGYFRPGKAPELNNKFTMNFEFKKADISPELYAEILKRMQSLGFTPNI
jgi:hypothetical protein